MLLAAGFFFIPLSRMAKTRRVKRRRSTRRKRSQRGGRLSFQLSKQDNKHAVVTIFPNPKDELENVPITMSLSRARNLLEEID